MLKNGDTMQRIDAAIINPKLANQLSTKEKELLSRLKYAAATIQNHNYPDAVKKIASGLDSSLPQISSKYARQIIQKTKEFFPDLFTIDRDVRQSKSINFYDKVADMALKKEDFSAAVRAREKADKLAQVGEDQGAGGILSVDAFNPLTAIMMPTVHVQKLEEIADNTSDQIDAAKAQAQFEKLLNGYEEAVEEEEEGGANDDD